MRSYEHLGPNGLLTPPRTVSGQRDGAAVPAPAKMSLERARVLLVDDDALMRSSLGRRLADYFDMSMAPNGHDALAMIERNGPFAVVVSDYHMPGMDGITFLSEVATRAPDTVRILLTAHADLDTAIEAVNASGIFRLLTKPCMPEKLRASVDAGVRQYALVTAEHELLQRTLGGAISALVDTLALANPLIFGRASRVRQLCVRVAGAMGVDSWEIHVAAMLSQLGAVSFPQNVLEKLFVGQAVSADELEMVERAPQTTDALLAHVPRLESAREIIRLQDTRMCDLPPAELPIGARILKAALDMDTLQAQGNAPEVALEIMQNRPGWYDPTVLEHLANHIGVTLPQLDVREVPIRGLRPGMRLMEEVRTRTGLLLIPKGYEVNAALVERVRNLPAEVVSGLVWVALG